MPKFQLHGKFTANNSPNTNQYENNQPKKFP